MAARRLLFALLVMLIISSFAAALAPIGPDEAEETTKTPPAGAPKEEQARGRVVERTVDSGHRRPPNVQVRLGDQLILTVEAERFAEIEIPALGELEDAEPAAPAVFDLLPPDPGEYAVRLLANGERVATIEVAKAR